jgi:hypothetical protein
MPRYDLFRLDDGSPLWIAAAETMADVQAQMGQLANCPECLVLDSLTGEKISVRPWPVMLRRTPETDPA